MDNREIPGENVVVSVTTSQGNVDGIERQPPVTPTWKAVVERCVPYLILAFFEVILGPILILISMMILMMILVIFPFVFVARKWKRVFILSCVAMSCDSLFLYIPIIDQKNKCLGMDKTLRNTALVLRSLTDIAFIFHILFLITGGVDDGPKWYDSDSEPKTTLRSWLSLNQKPWSRLSSRLELVRKKTTKNTSWLSLSIINFLAILPVPQVAIVVGFFRMGSSKHFFRPTIINIFLVFQYFLRISQIILSIKKIGTVGKWVKGSYYFLLYFIASYVLAAFWYFFSIQRETSCWDQACRAIIGCLPIYDCGHSTSLNSTFLNKLCPIDSPNEMPFDFGMFRDILKSGNTGSTNFSTKFFYSFWWGLKNLSNFGTNLETSSYIWENCFAILICVVGLLLFLFLIGNVQTFIQFETEKSVKIEESRRRSLNEKCRDIENWMSSHNLPDDRITNIMRNLQEYKVVEFIEKKVDAEFMRNCCKQFSDKSGPLKFVCMNALKKIPILRNMDEQVLEKFSEYKFTTKDEGSNLIQAQKELDTMYLIIDGIIECEDAETMRRNDFCGEEVLSWAIWNYNKKPRDPYPKPPVGVKCQTKIGAFTFTADQLIKILKKLENSEHFKKLTDPHESKTNNRIKDWLLRNWFPEDLKANIMNCLNEKNLLVEGNRDADVDVDVDVDFLFGILPENIKPSIKRQLGMNALKQVPMLQKMHEYVLEIICNHLETKVYEKNSCIVRAEEPLSAMIFILGGKIIMTDTTSRNATTTGSSEIAESSNENVLEMGGYYGEQLLSWASPNNISFSDNPVISNRDVKCETKVEALILKAEDLRSAVSKCGSQWNFNDSMKSGNLVGYGRRRVADTGASASTSPNNEQTIQLHQGLDMLLEQLILIRETVFQLRNDMSTQGQRLDDQGRRLDEMATFLAKLGYTGASPPPAP